MRILHIDVESSSAAELAGDDGVGVHKYAEHWTTRVYCMAWWFDDVKQTKLWHDWEPFPQEVIDHVAGGGTVVAHNAAFERTMWNVVMRRPNVVDNLPALILPELKIEQMVCTLARASTITLPAGLDYIAQVMGFENRKDPVGYKLMMKHAKPASRTKHPDGSETYTWHSDREERRVIGAYCQQDVVVELDVDRTVLQHAARERRVWELDQRINDRGVRLDLPLVKAAIEVVEVAKARLHTRMAKITDNEVTACSQVQKIVAWINAKGIPCTSIAKGVQQELILQAKSVDSKVEEVILLRQQSGKGTPTSKYQTMASCALLDGKAYGQLFYHGASTGRWAGRLIQFHNLPKIDEDHDLRDVLTVVGILGTYWSADEKCDAIQMVCGTVLPVLSKALRHMLIASEGRRFIGGDLSNIEGCVAAWISGEEWKTQAYRDFQAGNGQDLYIVSYSKSFGLEVHKVTKSQRGIGKIQELACGFQGSVGAYHKMCRQYNLNIAAMVGPIRSAVTQEEWDAAAKTMKRPGTNTYGLPEDQWTAFKVAVNGWRAAHPAVESAWYELQDAAIQAVAEPEKPVWCLDGKIAYLCSRDVLWCKLPSGRNLAYMRPYIKGTYEYHLQDGDGNYAWVKEDDVDGLLSKGYFRTEKQPRVKRSVIFECYESEKKRWGKSSLYGGLQFENIVQAVARDVMVEGMFAAEEKGYNIVLTVHDELLCDEPVGHGSAEELQSIMSTVPSWCPGLPLAAKCWEDIRYAK